MQGKLIPIPSYIEDPLYRYKMPPLKLKIEGKGNGIKTNIVNLKEVAECLNVPADYPLKFMGYELGSVTTYKQDRKECLCIINGEFEEDKMQTVLDRFIIKYVCCSKCKLPEIVLKIEEGKIKGDCKSCGNNVLLDNKHRMASYIVKSASTTDGKKKKGKQGDKNEAADKAAKLFAAKKRVKKEKVLSDPAVKLFKTRLAENNFPLNDKDETIKSLAETYSEVFHKNRKAEGATKKKNIEKAYRNLRALKIPVEKQVLYGYFIFNTLFTKNIANQVDKEASVLKDIYERSHRNTQMQHELVILLAHLLLEQNKEIRYDKFVPTIMMKFYQNDLLAKSFVKQWASGELDEVLAEHFLYSRDRNEKLREMSKQFLNFVEGEDAESESDDESGSSSSSSDSDSKEGGSDEDN